jgi:ATP/maltotriose-dependent transcriptional regulator MalT
MELIERTEFLNALSTKFENITNGEGHCVFVSGEAGIGKTSLVKAFCMEQKAECNIFQGACDALFTPRPLAPLYDIMWQVNSNMWSDSHSIEERSTLFTEFFRELSIQNKKIIIVFEDIHWADEATLDFIKFFARRITQLQCLFILTYRDNEIHSRHPLRTVLGQLPPDSFTQLQLTPLSREAVEKMAVEKGYCGENVYNISGGNPFYVNEILASYSMGVPDNIKNAILSTYNIAGEKTKQVWELLSVIPGNFEVKYLEKFDPLYAAAIENCIDTKILIINNGYINFKHELFRRTIESSLSPLKRISLNKKVLEIHQAVFEQNHEIERIIHHAKNANEYDTVVHYAPIVAKQAASLGAHIEASKLYMTAIEYYQGNDKDVLLGLYESYAYECYLTNQVEDAIIYTVRVLNMWKEKNDTEQKGNSLRFLSRLWWLAGNSANAEKFAWLAIDTLSELPSSTTKAMAYSNMSQLKMLFDQADECIEWGEKAIAIAKELNDEQTLSHALNNVASVYIYMPCSQQKGIDLLQQSLAIALKNSFHEHVARAYSNMGSNGLKMKNYPLAKKVLDEGIKYCEERGLESSRSIMLSVKALVELETGDWKKAYSIAERLLNAEQHLSTFTISLWNVMATIKMRSGEEDAVETLFDSTKEAFASTELQRIIPTMVSSLEYEWLTGKPFIKKEDFDRAAAMIRESIYTIEKNEFFFWAQKAGRNYLPLAEIYEGYDVSCIKKVQQAAMLWKKAGSPYTQAIILFEGSEADKKDAIKIVHDLGATAVYEKMKMEMRMSGIKSIPRGIRKSTQLNPALLTGREMDVLQLLKEGLQNKEIGNKLFISPKTVDHHISSILFKLDVNSRAKAVQEAGKLEIIK